jgi:L-fuculose-phosphate aldolase
LETSALYHADDETARRLIVETALDLVAKGIFAGTSGNISMRVEAGILVTPSAVEYAELTPAAIQLIPFKGNPQETGKYKPTTEWRFHQAIYENETVNSVIHAHPIYATALAMLRQPIPASHYMVAQFGGDDVPIVDYHPFGSSELARKIGMAMSHRTACLLANHGAVTSGANIKKAQSNMEELELLARMHLIALSAGQPAVLSRSDMRVVLEKFSEYRG